MTRFSHVLGVALAAAFVAGLAAASSPAAPPPFDHTLTTAHFIVHYNTCIDPKTDAPCAPALPPGGPEYTSETQAGDIAAYAERAYDIFHNQWGLPAPPLDADGHYDIYPRDLADDNEMPSLEAYPEPNNVGPAPSSGFIWITNPMNTGGFMAATGLTLAQEEQKEVANEVFVLFEFGTWVPTNSGDYWLLDGAAQWAAFQSIGYPSGTALTGLGPPDIALNCRDNLNSVPPPAPGLVFRMCDPDRWTEMGYTRWAFFQLLANKYGPSFIRNALVNGAAGQPATTALANAIAAKGSSLASVFGEYTTDLMDGNFGVPALSGVRPPAYDNAAAGTLTTTSAVKVDTIPVNHLAARYVTFQRGDGDGSHTCYAANLTVTVSLRYGAASQSFSSISSQPYFYWNVTGSTPQPLSINGSTASITVPWDTCDWGTTSAYLSLPNASTSVDAADFTVTMSQSVDFNTPATATPPPTQTPIWGTTVPVPTTDFAPTIDVFGPELIKVSATSRVIRLIVNSSGVGSLNASLGSTPLGTSGLRAGNNDIRFTVPASMLTALRKSASVTNVLTLTPMSSSGATAGQPVTRHVSIAAAVKAKPKHKKPKK